MSNAAGTVGARRAAVAGAAANVALKPSAAARQRGGDYSNAQYGPGTEGAGAA